RYLLFANALNNSFIEVVSNHNYPASRLLKRFGVSPEKIIPWDHPWDVSVYKAECKVLDETKKTWKLFFAGRIIKEKGVGDIIRAVSLLKTWNYEAEAVVAGYGRIDEFKKMAAEFDVADKICFLGNIAHEQVINNMKEADAVVVPSRIQAGEGIPCTIYEAMLVRTPLVLSTHPMFKETVEDAVFFKAGNAKSLAKSLMLLMSNRQLYNDLSSKSEAAVKKLIVPFSFSEIADRWLSGTEADRIWLKEHNLKNRKTNS
ncbi:MAG: glycosyltransferase family 4 protein, partial [Candidatus Omnitrophica bacterium]|nr:glycosyltransferase family 4 protein [Candidatus Omnitrophota bacterium]